ncbi:MAG: internalization-related competence protein ComEC/Rec2 protein [Candidatus Woesebacteria bacterium GW2011_GWA2_40_7b]|uniref:Internalization-related competence protein ComEC/Rec2 protein n=1 Tax=Candidatus Woesebacteria bacterium GW2011_GWA2_40_7b TaxID=1618563 RepID=A0A0G0VH57_9BACT|nr:MAG: internalization-related competence protein ComEC/Rec2 protein [Candidatus Woesebacteria bacterium GW2011_GWA2_40_7b]
MKIWNYIISLLILILAGVTIAIFQLPDNNLHIIACDVGQGDAILAIYKNTQILTDGGPDNKVVSCLGKYLPFWDRNIELVISTHPQKDHFSGLIEVVKRYKVDNILYSKLEVSSPGYKVLEKEVGSGGTNVIRPYTGQVLRIGLIQLDILNSSDEQLPITNFQFSNIVNDMGIVTLLKYGQFKALFTADVENAISDKLSVIREIEGVQYIKVNHHGSKNGLSENLLKAFMPTLAVISNGRNNVYGHPHKEILGMLEKYKVKVLRTDQMGNVEVVTDGEKYWLKN